MIMIWHEWCDINKCKKPRFRHELMANDTSKTANITKRWYYSAAHWHAGDVLVDNHLFVIFAVLDVSFTVNSCLNCSFCYIYHQVNAPSLAIFGREPWLTLLYRLYVTMSDTVQSYYMFTKPPSLNRGSITRCDVYLFVCSFVCRLGRGFTDISSHAREKLSHREIYASGSSRFGRGTSKDVL